MLTRLFTLLFLTVAPLAAQPYFDAPFRTFVTGTYENGEFPVALTPGDLDGDGLPDAIIGQNVGDGGIKILFNEGDAEDAPATFGEPVFYPLSSGAWGVVAADLDGDGDLDLAATNTDSNYAGATVAVLKNNGDGTFGDAQQYAAGGPSVGLTAADLDADGDLDLAVANYGFFGSGSTASVLYNDGTGAFPTRNTYSVGNDPYRIDAGDLDGDGDLDLAVARTENDLSVAFNNGDGTFGAAVQYNDVFPLSGTGAYADVAFLDLENDGDLDLAYTANGLTDFINGGAIVVLLRNDGTGALTPETEPYDNSTNNNPVADLSVADFDGDGRADLVGAQFFDFGYVVFRNNGVGSFLPAENYASVDGAGENAAVAATATVDLDSDGDADVLTVGRIRRLLSVHENLGDGAFPERPIYGDAFVHTRLDLGDVDGDGDLDAVTSSGFTASTANVLLNDGTGAFTESYATPTDDYGYAKLRDLDGDGTLDLLLSGIEIGLDDFFTVRGNGDGTFQSPVRWPINACAAASGEAFDLDHDGDLDVIIPEDANCGVGTGIRLFISLNNGDGTFQPAYTVNAGSRPFNLNAGDFDGDGNLDLVTSSRVRVSVILFGNGDGTFQPEVPIPASIGQNVPVLDLDGDGDLDIAKINEYMPTGTSTGEYFVSTLRNDGTGSFTETRYPNILTQSNIALTRIATADVDGDGDPDLMATGAQDAPVLLNDGNGAFAFGGRYGIARGAANIHLAELTGDSAPDLAAVATLDAGIGPFAGTRRGLVVVPGLVGSTTPMIVTATPVNHPIVIPAGGGSFQFTVTLTNPTGTTRTAEAWTAATGPVNRNPVLAPVTVTLNPGQSVTRTLTQTVPGNAPAGAYTYAVNVGRFPSVFAADSFPVEKQSDTGLGLPRSGGSGAATTWSVSGWEEAAASEATSEVLVLHAAYPNPTTGSAWIGLEVQEATRVRLAVYDVLGRTVAVLIDGELAAGHHTAALDGAGLAGGTYLIRLTTERGDTELQQVTLLR